VKETIIFCSVFVFAILLRLLVGLGGYSGKFIFNDLIFKEKTMHLIMVILKLKDIGLSLHII